MKKVISFGDLHRESKYFNILFPYMLDLKPDVIILAGDLFDFKEISDFDRHQRHYTGTKELQKIVEEEIRWGNDILDKIDKFFPSSERIFIKGNHDIRYDKYATYEQTHPTPECRLIENRIHLKTRGWKFVEVGGFYKLGKLYFLHGERLNGDCFAKVGALKFRKNIRLWHHHTNQTYCITSPLDSTDIVEAKAVGCLCEKDPVYLRGLTNRWMNSFLVAYILPKGNYQDYIVNIIGDGFISPEGRRY